MTDAKKPIAYDPLMLGAVLTLVGLGLVMVYSASAIMAQDKLGDSFFFLKRQAIAAAVGVFAMATAMKLGYRRMARLAYPLLIGCGCPACRFSRPRCRSWPGSSTSRIRWRRSVSG
jgi:cell division protein FtsW